MNIFVLSEDPVEAAQMQCDKHVQKMCTESAQMLSTVHRMLDGTLRQGRSEKTGRKVRWYIHPTLDDVLYKSVHFSHPCTRWTMDSSGNYAWHFEHFRALAAEFEYRRGKQHQSFVKLQNVLKNLPKNISIGPRTQFALAMKAYPECVVPGDPVQSYRNFYHADKARFAKWECGRPSPYWWKKKALIVDPPSGWKYGFPAPLQENYEKQLQEAGYPENEILFALRHSRYWEAEV